MPQVQRTTTSPQYSGYGSPSDFRAECDAIIASMNNGVKINSDHINRIRNLYNEFVGHRHQVFDQHFLAFGNLGNTSSSSTATTSTPSGKTAIPATNYQGSKLTTALINELIGNINSLNTHQHTVSDVNNNT